jgi:hypothetical protein
MLQLARLKVSLGELFFGEIPANSVLPPFEKAPAHNFKS